MRKLVAAAAVLVVLTVAAPAGAASWQVLVGEQAKPPAGTPQGNDAECLLPGGARRSTPATR